MDQENKTGDQSGGINVRGGEVSPQGDVVGRDKIVQEARVPAVPALHQLPPPPADFTGRSDELRELMEAVGNSGLTISGLHGLGGVGKTALALKLADRLKANYPDAQFYLDLKGVSKEPLTTKAAMEHVIRAYHPDVKLPESEADLAGLYQSVLHEKRALLLLDNARDARQVEPLIPPQTCFLLVTSRQHFTLPGLFPKNLDELTPPDARALLIRIASRLAQEKQDCVSELARLCGYLPLALRTVASTLAARITESLSRYVEKLADAQERLKLTATDASLQLSYDLLADDLKKRFRELAVFPDTFDAPGAAAVWEAETRVAEDALGELYGYSFLEFNPTSTRYRLHDLVSVFADARLDDEKERMTAQLRHAGYYKDVLAAADDLYLKGGEFLSKGLALFDLEWGNIQAGQNCAAARASEDKIAAHLSSQYPGAGVYCLMLRLHPSERIRWFEAGLAAARKIGYSRGEGIALGNLGVAYFSLGEYRRAIELHEQALAIDRELENRGGEGQDLGNLGIVYHSLGDYRRAIELHEQALAIDRELGNRRGEGMDLGNLGNAYFSLGEYRRAIVSYEQRLNIAREIGDRQGEGAMLGNLGSAYLSLGEYRRAIVSYEQRLNIAREIGDRQGEGYALGNMGNAYSSLGEYHRAIVSYEQRLKIAREIGDRQGEGHGLWNMSLTFDDLGDRARAVANAESALKILEQIEAPDVGKIREKLAEWRGNA